MEPIAIIGIGCRFPKAKDPESFWQLLRDGVDAISQVPKGRWDVDTFYDPKPGTPGKMNTRWGGFLEQVDRFDPNFFGISPREVERMDPQQRLVLEVGWEALENAGLTPQKLSGSQTGVFIGIGNYDYCRLLAKEDLARISAYDGTGNTLSIAANRLSYILNLRGPSVVIETACSSSLVALHFACRSLQSGESNLCLVGGVSLMLSPEPTINYSQARMMAADGRCKTFDASADGYVRGEGCGVVILKRLADAKRDEDNILAILKGSAVNQDGLSNGLTAPNGPSQQAVIRQALENAQIEPALISYVEAHGTGTSLGDPIEFKSLKAVLMQGRKSDQPCWLGSVKTNIGHLEAAAGMASLIKVVLSLQHKKIPPHLHLKQVNPYISLEGTTFSIPTKCQAWLPGTERRYAGISAFGFGGTNCHVILEEAPADFRLPILDFRLGKAGEELELLNSQKQINNPKSKIQNPKSIERPLHILTLSAKCEQALRELAQRYTDLLATHRDTSLADVCFTANTGRSHFEFRLAVLAESSMQLQGVLGAFAAGETSQVLRDRVNSKKRPRIAFLFTGQGSQHVGMGRELYETQPTFRAALDRCDRILRAYLEKPLLEVLYPSEASVQGGHKRAGGAEEAEGAGGEKLIQNPKSKIQNPKLIDETAYTQPALFALEYALVQLWKSWGIEPDAVMGHSVGEYVAACVAGVFSLEDGLKLIAERACLMQDLPQNGEMVAVFADQSRVQAAIQPYAKELAIAAINGPHMSVISGHYQVVQAVAVILQAEGIKTKKLNVSHAFHSPLMEPMLPAFARVAAGISYSTPNVKLISNLTGELATTEIATPEYWCRHVRQTVKFAASMETLHRQGYEVFVEIGPQPTLLGMARHFLPVTGFPSLQRGRSQWQQMLQSLAQLYMRGVSIDWSGFDRDYPRRRVVLPTYPFQRQRYWFETDNKFQKTQSLQENAPSVVNLLQGDIQHLAQQLEQTGELSAAQVQLLPKVLALLKQHQQQASIKDWFYNVQWQQRSRQVKATLENQVSVGSWLIFADRGSVGQTLAGLLCEQGHNCILVYAANTYNLEAGVASLNPSNPGDFERLLREVTSDRPLQAVVHLWSLEQELTEELTIPTLERAYLWSCGSVLHLVQALVKYNASTPPQLWLVTRGAVPVEPSQPAIAQAPLWGLGKVIALEHPELWGGMVDLAPQTSSDEAQKLLAEIGDSQGEDHLAFRDGQRYVARLVQQRPQSQKLTFHSDATYLITGGLGALGLLVAQWMVEQGAKQLVLTGRSGASSQAQETITRIEQAGAKVIVAQADVSKEEDITRVLEEVKATMPPLRGVVHTAGVLDDGILLQQDWEQFTRVMNPKVKGAWNLHVLTQNLPLDFFILFSSAASMLGSPGQGNYAAANTFLDVLAHYRQALGLPGLSINWGPWSSAGMAANLRNRDRDRLAAQGIKAIAPEQGMQVLQVLGSSAQVGVLPFDWSVFKQQLGSGHRSLLSELASETNSVEKAEPSPPQQELLRRLQEVAASDRQELLIAFIRDKVANVLGVSSSQLDVEQSLQDLGFDSLMAVELRSFIQTELQVDLPVRAFIEDPSINNLAALLLDQLIPGSATDVVRNELDLDAEAVLDPAISPVNARIEQFTEPAAILLTGATGFLGAFLLHNLLEQTEAKIYCLVRPSTESGKIRLQKNLESFDLWNENFSSRIIPIEGDLSQPQLGLSTEEFDWMASEIDTIYHNGAFLSYVYPYSRLKSINVLGTQEILRLACLNKVKPVHHISSVAVFESSAFYGKQVTEANLHLPSEGIFLGYSQTKWVSEKLVAIAGDRGLPVCIYRPPLISGYSQTGVWNTDGFLCRMIKGCIQMGSMPDLDLILDLSPVDYVARAVVYLSRQKESIGKAFHLQNPYPLHWRELVDFTSSSGYAIDKLSYEDWQVQLKNKRENPLYPLLPFFIQKWTDEQLTYIELNQQDKRPQIGCQETLNALANSSISCPPLDSKLLDTYFSYLIRSGFLDAPINKF